MHGCIFPVSLSSLISSTCARCYFFLNTLFYLFAYSAHNCLSPLFLCKVSLQVSDNRPSSFRCLFLLYDQLTQRFAPLFSTLPLFILFSLHSIDSFCFSVNCRVFSTFFLLSLFSGEEEWEREIEKRIYLVDSNSNNEWDSKNSFISLTADKDKTKEGI